MTAVSIPLTRSLVSTDRCRRRVEFLCRVECPRGARRVETDDGRSCSSFWLQQREDRAHYLRSEPGRRRGLCGSTPLLGYFVTIGIVWRFGFTSSVFGR